MTNNKYRCSSCYRFSKSVKCEHCGTEMKTNECLAERYRKPIAKNSYKDVSTDEWVNKMCNIYPQQAKIIKDNILNFDNKSIGNISSKVGENVSF